MKCPICDKELKSLFAHLVYVHGMEKTEISKKYPNLPLHTDVREKQDIICKHCGKHFTYQNGFAIHMKKIHPDFYVKKERVVSTENKPQCLICGVIKNNMSQHVITMHNMTWDEYCEKTGYTGPKSYFSDIHKKTLSENKRVFYNETKRGLELKKEQSEMYSGDKNPAKNADVKRKISENAIKRLNENTHESFYRNSYGIIFHFLWNGIEYRTRSFEEMKVVLTLLIKDIDFKYENTFVKYDDEGVYRTYLVDFVVKDTFFEIKGDRNLDSYRENKKYSKISEYLKKIGTDFQILDYDGFCSYLGIEKIKPFEIKDIIRDLLRRGECKIQQTLRPGSEPKLIESIWPFYDSNENITISYKEKKHELSKDILC